MPNPKTVGCEKKWSLSELQVIVQQNEELLGPLNQGNPNGLGNNGQQTLLSFDMDKEPPTKLAILRPTVAGLAVPLYDHDLICIGKCFVSYQLTELAAYRPR